MPQRRMRIQFSIASILVLTLMVAVLTPVVWPLLKNSLAAKPISPRDPQLTTTIEKIGQYGNAFSIRVGSDDGLCCGQQFTIYRANRYIGCAKVVRVKPNIAVLQSIKDMAAGPIQVGDHVTNTF